MDETCTINLEPVDMNIGTSCLICGKTVEYTNEEALALIHAGNYTTKVCDECKKAIEWVKDTIQADEKTAISPSGGCMRDGDYPPGVTGNEPELNGIDEMWIPDPCCGNCTKYHEVCTKGWSKGEADYVPERDDKDETDCCDDYDWNGEYRELPREPVRPKRNPGEPDWRFNIRMNRYHGEHIRWQREYHKAIMAREREE